MEHRIAELYQSLLHFVKKRVNNQHDAEDLTQEVFLKLAKSDLGSIQNVKSWIYAIARNTITDYYRKKKIPVDNIDTFDLVIEEAGKSVVEELSCCIERYVDQLPDDYRAIIRLSELENVPQKEIAIQLNMNYATVRSKVQRGRKKLKVIFGECCTFKQGGRGSILEYTNRDSCCDKN